MKHFRFTISKAHIRKYNVISILPCFTAGGANEFRQFQNIINFTKDCGCLPDVIVVSHDGNKGSNKSHG